MRGTMPRSLMNRFVTFLAMTGLSIKANPTSCHARSVVPPIPCHIVPAGGNSGQLLVRLCRFYRSFPAPSNQRRFIAVAP
jgi:hypothetical protein